MTTAYQLEEKLYKMSDLELIHFFMSENYLMKENNCFVCSNSLVLAKLNRSIDMYSWRCMTKTCTKYKSYYTIRKNSFFDGLKIGLRQIFLILLKYSCKLQRYQIILSADNSAKTVKKILKKFVMKIPITDFSNNKLGGPGKIVQIDETMLNYKCKSHRGRSPENKTDSLCIVEVSDKILRAYATIISKKKETTIIPIIRNQVASNSMIWTDEQ
ncbi:hypothetical protein H312_01354 [Anncaliia algerae PRA339]|uniref:Uncharacterized protein n=1 Tax=Anncaliia algerae PRA339 TaxID=1288291 RepID=A0A059F1P5_9MICR|nr:hypothetical protein H312_01354 [Anncaliia algerae PRA339]